VVDDLLRSAAKETRAEIMRYCWTEKNRPFTLNEEYTTWFEEQRTALAIGRHGSPVSSHCPPHVTPSHHFELVDAASGQRKLFATSEENLCTVLAAYGINLSSMEQLARIHKDDYDAELEVIAHVKAYFEVASKRIIDDIPMIFETNFAISFAKNLETYLPEKLNLVGPGGLENCTRYVCDEPDIQKKRKDWTRQLEILKKAETKLIKFYISN
jgi:Dynamin GTPase effector domain